MYNWIERIQKEMLSVMADMGDYDKGFTNGMEIAIGLIEEGGGVEGVEYEQKHWDERFRQSGLDFHQGNRDGLKRALDLC